jgi:hypothetical protein
MEDAVQRTDTHWIQQSLFVLRIWDVTKAVQWLIEFVHLTDKSWCARARALSCLWCLADESTIRSIGNFTELCRLQREAYFRSRLELLNLDFDVAQFSPENAPAILERCSLDEFSSPWSVPPIA